MNNNLIQRLQAAQVNLQVVDGKLKVNAPKGKLTTELLEAIKLNKEQLIQLLSKKTSIPKADLADHYPLTPTQYFMWFTHEHMGGNRAYNITSTLKLKGDLNIPVLEQAFREVINRHESLRTIFKEIDEEVRQFVLEEQAVFNLSKIELTDFSKPAIETAIHAEYQSAFALDKDILVRAKLITDTKDQHILLFVIHHIIGDGWSLQVLMREVMTLYNNLVNGIETEFSDLTIQYKDYSVWLNDQLNQPVYQQKLDYWKTIFSEEVTPLSLPLKSTRPSVKTYNGCLAQYQFANRFYKAVQDFSKKRKATPFMTLMAGLNGLLARYTGQFDITLGTTVAGRSQGDLENQIGLYSNALAVRTRFESSDAFHDLVEKQRATLHKAYDNQAYPFTKLVQDLNLPVDKSRSPLFDVMVLFQSHRSVGINDQKGIKGIETSEYNEVERDVSQQDITFIFVEEEEGLGLTIEYNTDLFDSVFIQQLAQHLEQFITSGITNPNALVSEITFISEAEKSTILTQFNQAVINTNEEAPRTIVDALTQQLKTRPDETALLFKGKATSYADLDYYASQLANYLEKDIQIQTGDFVGIEMERGTKAIITMLAVLKTGAVYVPIDPSYPAKRKAFIYEDSQCKFIITDNTLSAHYTDIKKHAKTYTSQLSPTQLAYMIYTSGSTGNPKGVQITHASLMDYVNTFSDYFELSTEDRVLQQASISFDTSVEEIFPILSSGGTLVIQEDKTDFEGLLELCEQTQITILSTNPFVLQYLNQAYDEYNFKFRILISGGDVLKPEYVNKLWQRVAVYNTYGPTESTVCATYHKVGAADTNTISIGKPIQNRQVYILEKGSSTQLCPIGIEGELCIAGAGLSVGYLNRPELTRERFVPHPFIEKQRMYRSGDLARWTRDGQIEFVGRKDHQVKVRGYRIELGEIEQALLAQAEVRQAVALVKGKSDDKFIVAYIEGATIELSKLKEQLAKELPEYMVPAHFEVVNQIPLTTNGKIDRKALQNRKDQITTSKVYVAPKTELEKQLARFWEEILDVEKVGVNDNFFELGGHSLKVVKLTNRIRKELGYRVKVNKVFSAPTISALVTQLQQSAYLAIPKAEASNSFPTTAAQRRLWVLSKFEGGSSAYNIVNTLELRGAFDYNRFAKAIRNLIRRHESLRTSFREDEQAVLQQFIMDDAAIQFDVPFHDIRNKEPIAAEKIIASHYAYQFDLSQGPLIRVEVIQTAEDRYLVVFNLHHIIGDGWSMEILSRETVAFYSALETNEQAELSPLTIQYKDFAVWSNSEERKAQLAASEMYWLEKLGGEIPVLELPSDFNRPKIKTYNGAEINYDFSTETSQALNGFVRKSGATLFMGLVAALNGLFYKYTGQKDITLGTPIAGRAHSDLENQVGLFLNTLAIRTQFDAAISYQDLLLEQKKILQEAYEHQAYPFDELVDQLDLQRDVSRAALFDFLVVLHNQNDIFEQQKVDSNAWSVQSYRHNSKTTSQFDITFAFKEKAEGLSLAVEYNTDIYSEAFIQKLIRHLEQFMRSGIENPTCSLEQLTYLSKAEKTELLVDLNTTKATYPQGQTLVDLLEQQAAATPDALAVVFENNEITYREIQERSNQLAHFLLHQYEITSEDFVGLKLARDEWMVIALIAILKTGAAYVPIDPKYPAERIAFIESDSNCKVTITSELVDEFKKTTLPTELPKVKIDPEQIAYVIYTSGSTGRPKGVMIKHSNVVSLMHWSADEFKDTPFDIMYAVTSYCFDLSVFEIFFPLSIGKHIRVLENGLEVGDYVNEDRNILINTVPSVVRELYERAVPFTNVVAINMAGEPIPVALSNALVNMDLELRNLYGPSEDTTYSSIYRIEKTHEHSIPIGVPVSNTQFYVLSDALTLQARTVAGELCIAGEKLSNAYLNRPELNAEKFIPNPFKEGTLMYRTGDLVRWMPDGNLEFIGRKDDQVKIRGYRIELGEIENALQAEAAITQAVVLIKEIAGDQHIVAYLTGTDIKIGPIRNHLSKRLPRYMVPAHYLVLDTIPLTPNGKTDKKKLLELEVVKINTTEYVEPRNETEKALVPIWEKVLKVNTVGVLDNFFELGGHSVHITRMLHGIDEAFDVKLPMKSIFAAQSIEDLARLIEDEIIFKQGITANHATNQSNTKNSKVWEI